MNEDVYAPDTTTQYIELLVGTIASGKSTFSRARARLGEIVINDDAIVTAVHGGDYTLYDERLKCLYKGIEVHLLHAAVGLGRRVIVDKGLNLTARARQRWIAIGRSLDIPVRCRVFPFASPEEHARRRMASDPRDHDMAYWTKVAQRHIDVYEEPSLDEGLKAIAWESAYDMLIQEPLA